MGSNPIRGAIFNAPIAQRVERLVEAQEAAGSRPARCTTDAWRVAKRQCAWLLTRSSSGSNPASPATYNCSRIAQLAERRSYKAEVLGSTPSACTTHATLAQWIRVPVCDAGGRRFNSFTSRQISLSSASRSGRLPLTEKTGVRIPMRAPLSFPSSNPARTSRFQCENTGSNPVGNAMLEVDGGVSSIGRAPGGEPGRCGFESRTSLQSTPG